MNRTEHLTKTPRTSTGFLAALAASLRAHRIGAPALGAALLSSLLLCVLPATASADSRIGSPGVAAGQLGGLGGLAVSSAEGGDVYVVDSGTQRIDQFQPDGTFVRAFGWGVRPLATGSGSFSAGTNVITEVSTKSGSFAVGQVLRINVFENFGAAPTITAIGSGTLTLSSNAPQSRAGESFNATEATPQTCTVATGCIAGIGGAGPGQFEGPDEIAVDNDPSSGSYGDIYVVDQDNFRVEKYSPSGEFLLMFGGEVDKTTGADVCTAAEAKVDTCGAGVSGTGPSHFYEENPPTGGGGSFANKAWFTSGNNSIAVGPEGSVYVGDYGRIQEFEPDGVFAGEFKLPVEIGKEPQFAGALAVNSEGDIFERSQTVYRDGSPNTEVPGVREFGPAPTHQLLHTFNTEKGSDPTHIALDAENDLITSDVENGEVHFRAFKPSGSLYAIFDSDQVAAQAAGIAVNGTTGTLYVTSSAPEGAHVAVHALPQPGPPTVAEQKVTDIEPTTATLHAILNPEQFDTKYRFQYTTTNFSNCGEPANPQCAVTPATPADLGSVSQEDPVTAALSNLTSATVYHWRVVAASEAECEAYVGHVCEAAPEAEFETLPDVSVRNLATQTVGPELVALKAELNPNNGGSTEYTICYGETESYSSGCSHGVLKVLGSEFEPVSATFSGLHPNSSYHYRLTAKNHNGEVQTADQVFTTEHSTAEERAAEDCPDNGTVNGQPASALREEDNSLSLPDCRAYEQVSPVFKAGYGVNHQIAIGLPDNQLSPGGERDAFYSNGSFAGATAIAGFGSEYVAHRTATGWVTEPTLEQGGPDWSARLVELNAELDAWDLSFTPPNGTGIPPIAFSTRDQAGPTGQRTLPFDSPEGEHYAGSVGVPITPLAQSSDLSRLYLGAYYPLLPTDQRPIDEPGGSAVDRIYNLEGVGGPSPQLSLAAEVPLDLTEMQCQLDTAGWRDSSWSSTDGSTLFYTAPLDLIPGGKCENGEGIDLSTGPNKEAVFARIGSNPPIQLSAESPTQCSSGHPCSSAPPAVAYYDGSSPDGARAWITTAQPLINSDTDETSDLYLAKLNTETDQLSELVQASAGESAPGHPHPGEGAGVLGVVNVSPDGSHVAYVATGALTTAENQVHQSAAQGADNLYVYDADTNETRFVARLCSGPELSGSHAEPYCPADLSTEADGKGTQNDTPLWGKNQGSPSEFTPDGEYLLFTSYGRLSPDDTDTAPDVYRYDFQTGQLLRLSFGHDGNDANGNDDAYPASINGAGQQGNSLSSTLLDGAAEDASRSISSDGSTVIFSTAAPLVSRDTNASVPAACGIVSFEGKSGVPGTGCDVYEWQEDSHGTCHEAAGCISLISNGLTAQGAASALISSSGRDITFITAAGLLPSDTDGVSDVYDARENGGFPYAPPPIPCGGNEVCHNGAGPEPTPPKITTEGETGGNGLQQLQCAKGKVRVTKNGQVRCVAQKSHKAKHHKKHKRAAGHKRGGAK